MSCLAGDCEAASDVFKDLPSGLVVVSGDSLDLLSADASILTSSDGSGEGGAPEKLDTLLPLFLASVLGSD